jgi:hypothetical protein
MQTLHTHEKREMKSLARGNLKVFFLITAAVLAVPKQAQAQTDYYNLDPGRPVRIEDAYAKERYAFELTLPSLKLERSAPGVYQWTAEPELAYGLLPRTHFKIGIPIVAVDDQAGGQAGIAGIDLGLFHNLNAETSLPAIAVSASIVVPAGNLAPQRLHPAIALIGTRSLSIARVHANVEYTFGRAGNDPAHDGAGYGAAHETSRWLAGVALDKTLPLRSMLLIADVYAAQPLDTSEPVSWNVETGIRYQLSPGIAIDAGVGKLLTGGDRGWFLTFGTAYAFGLRSLIPVRR